MKPVRFHNICGPWGLALLSACVLSWGTLFGATGIDNQKIDSGLQTYLTGQNVEWVHVLVMLKDRVDTKQLERQSAFRQVRHQMIVSALQEKAQQTQAGLLQYLESAKQQDQVKKYKNFWITNLVAAEVRPEIIEEIANRPEVETVYLDYPIDRKSVV